MKKNKNRICVVFIFFLCIICSFFVINKLKIKKESVKYLENMGKGEYSVEELQKKQPEFESNLQIKNIDYKWKEEFIDENKPKIIVIHHSATTKETPEEINEAHKQKGWNGIGYHFYITKEGIIYRGRPEEVIGSHTYGRNRDTIGICLEGNFENESPTTKQIDSLINLSADLIIKYNLEGISRHSDFNSTLCPGKNLLIDTYKDMISQKILSMNE